MAERARIRDGRIETVVPEVGRLADGRTVTGYHLLPDDVLAQEGWHPIVDDGPPDHDPASQQVARTLEVRDGQVVAVYTVEARPEPQPTEQDRLAALEAEVAGIRERAAAANVADPDARRVRDAVAGP